MNYILLFGMPGGGELIFIVLIIIMLFGSKKIPELARGLGKGMREIKNATNEIQQEIRDGAREMNVAKEATDVEKQIKDLIKEEKEPKEEVSRGSEETNEENKPSLDPNTVQRRNPYSTTDSEESKDNS